MADQASLSILGRNEIGCHGLCHILSGTDFVIDHCMTHNGDIDLTGWADDANHIILVDSTSVSQALDLCATIHAALPQARIVILCDTYELDAIRRAFAIDINGILPAQMSSEALVSAVKLIALGEKIMPSQLIQMLTTENNIPLLDDSSLRKSVASLSDREVEILRCVAAGQTNKAIAQRLDLSEATVKAQIKAILRKLHVTNRTQAAIWAIGNGLNQMAEPWNALGSDEVEDDDDA
jgi:two-component system nitrate/nitrite response regulator NarL